MPWSEYPLEGGQHCPIVRRVPRSGNLPTDHRELVAQHDDSTSFASGDGPHPIAPRNRRRTTARPVSSL